MSKTINGDDIFEERRGRVVGRDQHMAAARSRARQLLSVPSSRRAAPAGPGAADSANRQSVLKVIAWTKSHRAAPAQARYISRAGDAEKEPEKLVTIEDEEGRLHNGREAVDKVMATWNLTKDRDNQAPAARELEKEIEALRQKGARAEADEKSRELRDMKQNSRLNTRQAVHMIFSVPAKAGGSTERLKAATREALQESFGAAGHKYVFAVHTDHSDRPHVHIIAKARSEPGAGARSREKSLRLGPAELHALRVLFTEKAKAHGIDVEATRRVDREHLRDHVAQGRTPLRQNLSKGKVHTQEQSKQGGTYAAKAPGWYATHGAAYEKQRLAEFTGRPAEPSDNSKQGRGLFGRIFKRPATESPALASGLPAIGKDAPAGLSQPAQHALRRLDAQFAQTYGKGAERARESFIQMYREAPKLAVWSANQHPQAFGQVIDPKAPRSITARGLNGLLKEIQRSAGPAPAAPRQGAPAPTVTPAAAGHPTAAQTRQAADAARDRAQQQRSVPKMAQQLETAARQVERQAGPEGAAAAAKIRSMAGEKLSAADKQSIMDAERQRLINRDKAQRERNREQGRDID